MLSRINFADLALVLWQSANHFLPMQNFLKEYDQAIYEGVWPVGIISGCEITPVSGLTVRVAAGKVLFSNGEMTTVAQQDIALNAADATNPRIDRLELIYSLENNATVTDINSTVKQFDKVHTGTLTPLAGTPAGSPVIPTQTAGAISLGSVDVAATQTVLAASDINQDEKVRDISRIKNNHFGDFSVPQSTTGAEAVAGLFVDKTRHKQVWLDYQINRKTDTASSGKVQSGTLSFMINPESGDWERSDDRKGSTDVEVEFTVDGASGQVSWDITNLAGANHIGEFTFNTRTLDV